MNWTEGSLARHSRGRSAKETLLRQKQHFAKVRSGLSNSNAKISPSSISFLGRISSPHSSQHSSVGHGSGSGPATKRRKINPAPADPDVSILGLASRRFKSSGLTQLARQEGQALDESRKRLLQKSDWVGIAIQKPLDLQFPVARITSGHPWSQHGSHGSTWRSSARHIMGSQYDQMKSDHREGRQHTNVSPIQNFRIRVGSREIRLGTSSNTSSERRISSRTKKSSRKRDPSKRRRLQQSPSSCKSPTSFLSKDEKFLTAFSIHSKRRVYHISASSAPP